jgi:hypothetical protein
MARTDRKVAGQESVGIGVQRLERPVAPEGSEREIAIVSLHRYWLWADAMRQRFFELLPCEDEDTLVSSESLEEANASTTRSVLYGSYWLAGLYVAVEGWRELELDDPSVSELMEDKENLTLLRRYRNAVFHFRRDYADRRFFDLLEAGSVNQPWELALHGALGAALRRLLLAI